MQCMKTELKERDNFHFYCMIKFIELLQSNFAGQKCGETLIIWIIGTEILLIDDQILQN